MRILISRSPLDLSIAGRIEKIVPDGRHVRECLQHHVAIIVGLDVVEANYAGKVQSAVVCAHLFATRFQVRDHLHR